MKLQKPRILEVRILVPIWGDDYIEDFLNYSMNALLLDRNIPTVSKKYKVTMNFLTTVQGEFEVKSHKSYEKIKRYTNILFTSVEDLVVNANYSTTLTLAYARGLQSIPGSNYFRTLFILLNSDFILSNGSLNSLVQKAENGASAVYGASLRIKGESARKKLSDEFNKKTKQKFFSSRSLVRYAMKILHPTVNAMTINQNIMSYQIYTKIYWKLSEKILISHDYLLCCMGLVPIRRLEQVTSYVDYSFAAELSDPKTRVVIDDSDDYLAIEIQDMYKESEFIESGAKSLKYLAKHISSWTTKEHREVSNSLIKFHAINIPKDFAKQVENFEEYYSQLSDKLTRAPMSHINHPHWVGGINAWMFHFRLKFGKSLQLGDVSPTIRPISNSLFASSLKPRISLLYRRFLELGLRNFRHINISSSLFSSEQIDFELMSKSVDTLQNSSRALIIILGDFLAPKEIKGAEVLSFRDFHRAIISRKSYAQKYANIQEIKVFSELGDPAYFLENIDIIRNVISKSANISFHISNHRSVYGSSDLAKRLVQLSELTAIRDIQIRAFRKKFLSKLERYRGRAIRGMQVLTLRRVLHILFFLFSFIVLNFCIFLVNLLAPLQEGEFFSSEYDSMKIQFHV